MSIKYFTLVIIGLLISSVSSATDLNNCLVNKYGLYTKAKENWQIESTHLIIRHSPHLKEVAELYRDDQLFRIEKNQLAVSILIYSNSKSVSTNKKLRKWLSLSDEEELSLASENIRYKELLESVQSLRTRDSHPDGTELRGIMRSKIMKLPKFQLLLKKINIETEKADQLQCNAA